MNRLQRPTTRIHWRVLLFFLVLSALSAPPLSGAARAEPLALSVRSVPLDAGDPERTRVGALEFRGGLELRSSDPRFGGLSGLRVSADGKRFVAITDVGFWMAGALRYDAKGRLVGVADVALEPLRDAAGRALTRKRDADAEAVTEALGGGYIVAFEGRHRLVRYRRIGGSGETLATPPDLADAPVNGGIEALTTLADGRLLIITETMEVDAGSVGSGVRGWIGPAPWRPLVWPTDAGFRPTEAATLPNGDVLILERRFPLLAARLRRVGGKQLQAGGTLRAEEIARFEGSLTFDNMEAMAVRRSASGETLVFLASDDNQNTFQHTLLLLFELLPTP